MKQLMLIALGGALGSVLRWKLSGGVLHLTPDWRFPLGTFVVNVLGCLVAGLVAGMVVKLEWFTPDTRLFLLTGVLGGFTTFSAFGVETFYLLRRQEYGVAFGYMTLSLICGLLALACAYAVVRGRT
jgi:CrcB protein